MYNKICVGEGFKPSPTKHKKDMFYLINKYSNGISRVESEMLLEYLFNCNRVDLYTKDLAINEVAEELYDSLVGRWLGGEPVQYITGKAEFMGFDFMVTRDTLIPRPETELLINEICRGGFETRPYMLDLCTGCGNIAVSLAKLIPNAEIIGTDISGPALRIAEKNAMLHKVSERIRFYKGDLFEALMFDKNQKFDIIVCNPPYVKEDEIPFLQKEVAAEPGIALNGGEDGLDFYRRIAKGSRYYLKQGGSLVMETGFGQADAVKDIFSLAKFEIDKVIKDFAGIERLVWINLL
ncbi:MAG: peptide chain release factor N(5)-glutamine methyltransferase [Candidatus Omnitrophota bacterium]